MCFGFCFIVDFWFWCLFVLVLFGICLDCLNCILVEPLLFSDLMI